MKVVGFVPARSGSTRLPNKNIQKILGVPLFLWAANNLNKVLPKSDIYIDTNSDEIIRLAKKHGFGAIRRPETMASNATNGNEFMLWEVSNVDADIYVQHLPPMPFLRRDTLERALKMVAENGHDSSFAVIKDKFYLWAEDGPQYDLLNLPNSYDLESTIIEAMGLYVTTKESILDCKTRIGRNPAMIEIDKFEAIDIDYPEDFEFAKAVASGLDKHSPYLSGIRSLIKVENIKMVVFDVDGVLTDGGMYYAETGDEFKKFNSKDGMAIKKLSGKGLVSGFLSSGFNEGIIRSRANLLGVTYIHSGEGNKHEILTRWCKELGFTISEVAYIGDDINDMVLASHVGLFACPADASRDVKLCSDIVLDAEGGKGCVREFLDNYIL